MNVKNNCDSYGNENMKYTASDHTNRLEMALQGSQAGLWDWNIVTGEVWFNYRFYEMLGYKPGDFEPHVDSWKKLVHPDDWETVMEVLENHISGKTEIYQTEHRLRRKRGDWLWVLDTGRVMERNANGVPVRAVGTHMDINHKKKIEFDLQHNLRQQELLSEIALDLNALEEFPVRINKALQQIGEHTGVSRVYIFEDTADGLFCNNTYEWYNEGIDPQIDELQDVPYEVIPSAKKLLLGAEGRIYSENIANLPADLYDILEPQGVKSIIIYPLLGQGRFLGYIGFDECMRNKEWSRSELELLRTVSGIIANTFERKLMETSLENERDRANEANEAKSRFLANMSHEIRTPMNAVLGFSEALARELQPGRQQKMVRSILSSGSLLLSLLNDILDLSKIEAGRMTITPRPLALSIMIEDIHVLFLEQSKIKGINFSIQLDEALPPVVVLDEVRIKQVIFNLVGNAIKFTHHGKVILTVNYIPERGSVGELQIDVADTGIGIPESDLQIIFEPFIQQSGQSNRDYEGAGLGLSICKRLIEQMGGSLTVESRLGEGSRFMVRIPGVEMGDESEFVSVFPSINEDILFNNNTILMVDDVVSNLDAMEALLSESGLELVRASSGEIALSILETVTPDMILLDIRMPGMDGYEVAKEIRGMERLADVKIIACTAMVVSDDQLREMGLFDGYLFKPVRRRELFSVLGRFMKYMVKETRGSKEDFTENVPTKVSLDDPPTLTEEVVGRLPELIAELEGPVTEQWEEIGNRLVLFRIESFADVLSDLADRVAVPSLERYVAHLMESLKLFDLEQIGAAVEAFPQMVEQLRGLMEKGDAGRKIFRKGSRK